MFKHVKMRKLGLLSLEKKREGSKVTKLWPQPKSLPQGLGLGWTQYHSRSLEPDDL